MCLIHVGEKQEEQAKLELSRQRSLSASSIALGEESEQESKSPMNSPNRNIAAENLPVQMEKDTAGSEPTRVEKDKTEETKFREKIEQNTLVLENVEREEVNYEDIDASHMRVSVFGRSNSKSGSLESTDCTSI